MYFKIEYILFVKKILFVKTFIGKKYCILFFRDFLVSVCLSLSKLLIPPMPSIPVLLESIRSGSVNQFNRILRSISSTNISMKEIINSSAEQFSFLQQFIDLV